jgi:hypothetical protein
MCFVYEDHMQCSCVANGVIPCCADDHADAALPHIADAALPHIAGVDWRASEVCHGIMYHAAHDLPLCARHAEALAHAQAQQGAFAAAALLGSFVCVDITLGPRVLATVLLSHLANLTLRDLSDYARTPSAGAAAATDASPGSAADAAAPSPSPALPALAAPLAAAPAEAAQGDTVSGGKRHDNNGGGHDSADAPGVADAARPLPHALAGKVAFDRFELGACADWLGGDSGGGDDNSCKGSASALAHAVGDLRLGDLALGEVVPVPLQAGGASTRGVSDKLWRRTLRELSAMTWVQVRVLVPERMQHTFDGGPTQVTLALLAHVALYEMGFLV